MLTCIVLMFVVMSCVSASVLMYEPNVLLDDVSYIVCIYMHCTILVCTCTCMYVCVCVFEEHLGAMKRG